jgi:hypothetical protein
MHGLSTREPRNYCRNRMGLRSKRVVLREQERMRRAGSY